MSTFPKPSARRAFHGVYLNGRSGRKDRHRGRPGRPVQPAIGRDGQNARLAAKLTGWRIDIKSLTEAASDAIVKVQSDPALAAIALAEHDHIPAVEEILAKESAWCPLTPEEFLSLIQLFETTRRFDMQAQPQLVLLQKTMVVVEGVARSLDPDFDIWEAARPVAERWVSRQSGPGSAADARRRRRQRAGQAGARTCRNWCAMPNSCPRWWRKAACGFIPTPRARSPANRIARAVPLRVA